MNGGRRPLQGRKLADRRVRIERPHTVVVNVPYRREDESAAERAAAEAQHSQP